MYIKRLNLFNFRNYEQQALELGSGLNIFVGGTMRREKRTFWKQFMFSH